MTTSGEPKKRDETIVLLHGFAAHWTLMSKLDRHFQSQGFDTINWGYNSWFRPIDFHAGRLAERLHQLEESKDVRSIHFVTHSMGCIVTRAALLKQRPSVPGRWVQLAPPNRGSHVANSIPRFIRSRMKPIEELRAKPDSYVNRLPMPQGIDIAIIEATRDYIVANALTRVEEEKDRIVVPGLHSQMLFRQDVALQTQHFLEHGRFDTNREATDPTAANPE